MSCESCGCESDKITYLCSRNPGTCPPREVNKDEPVPECCGEPMFQQEPEDEGISRRIWHI